MYFEGFKIEPDEELGQKDSWQLSLQNRFSISFGV